MRRADGGIDTFHYLIMNTVQLCKRSRCSWSFNVLKYNTPFFPIVLHTADGARGLCNSYCTDSSLTPTQFTSSSCVTLQVWWGRQGIVFFFISLTKHPYLVIFRVELCKILVGIHYHETNPFLALCLFFLVRGLFVACCCFFILTLGKIWGYVLLVGVRIVHVTTMHCS